MGFTLEAPAARPLLTRYAGGEATRRYYQDAAIRAVLEKLAARRDDAGAALAGHRRGQDLHRRQPAQAHRRRRPAAPRALRLRPRRAAQPGRCGAFQNVFGADAAAVSTAASPQKNARIHIATYQTLDVDTDEADANFLTTHYPENYFSHIIIDECHRSAWGKWSQVLTRNPNAVQIGLTATPRQLEMHGATARRPQADAADHRRQPRALRRAGLRVRHGQGIEDGYLAACEIRAARHLPRRQARPERETGLEQDDLAGKTLARRQHRRAAHGRARRATRYDAAAFEDRLLLPDRVRAMCRRSVRSTCSPPAAPSRRRSSSAPATATPTTSPIALNNLYAAWCAEQGRAALEPYAFKCTAACGGNDYLPDLRGASRRHFIATTVDLLDDRRRRAVRPQHRLLQVRALAHRLLPDGRPRHAHRPADGQAHVPRLRLHRRHPPLRRGVHDQVSPATRARGLDTPERAEPPSGPSRSRASTCA